MSQSLYEKYRPKEWSEVLGQQKAIKAVKLLAAKGLKGRCFWLSGQSGTGKTTIARLIAAEVADVHFITEIDAGTLSVSGLAKIEADMHYYAPGKGGRCYIINEAHGLSRPVIRQFLVLLERVPAHCTVVFTTTVEGQKLLFTNKEDTSPLLSRCIAIELARRDLAGVFAARAQQIADKEGLNGQPIEKYVKLVQTCRNNFRAVLQAVESGKMLSD